MAEYINREDAIQTAKAFAWGDNSLIVERMQKIPAADVVERKKGKWIPDEWDTDDDLECICSCCREQGLAKQGRWDVYLSNFCPHCGAEMFPTLMSGTKEEEHG